MTYVVAQPVSPHYALITSTHRSLYAALRQYKDELDALRRVPGYAKAWLGRIIAYTTQTGPQIEIRPDELIHAFDGPCVEVPFYALMEGQ